MILAIVIFCATLALILTRPFGVGVGIWALLGGGFAWALGAVDFFDIAFIFGKIWNSTLTLIALVILSKTLETLGFFDFAAARLIEFSSKHKRADAKILFILLLFFTAVLSVSFANDGAILIITPLVLAIFGINSNADSGANRANCLESSTNAHPSSLRDPNAVGVVAINSAELRRHKKTPLENPQVDCHDPLRGSRNDGVGRALASSLRASGIATSAAISLSKTSNEPTSRHCETPRSGVVAINSATEGDALSASKESTSGLPRDCYAVARNDGVGLTSRHCERVSEANEARQSLFRLLRCSLRLRLVMTKKRRHCETSRSEVEPRSIHLPNPSNASPLFNTIDCHDPLRGSRNDGVGRALASSLRASERSERSEPRSINSVKLRRRVGIFDGFYKWIATLRSLRSLARNDDTRADSKKFQNPTLIAFLLATGFVADVSSSALPISNLTNIITADFFALNFYAYARAMFLPNCVAVALSAFLLFLFFRRNLSLKLRPKIKESTISTTRFLALSLFLIATLGAFFVADFFALPVSFVATIAALILVFYAKIAQNLSIKATLAHAPWDIIYFSLGLFVVVFGVGKAGASELIAALFTWLTNIGAGVFGVGIFSAIASNILNNLPANFLANLALDSMLLTNAIPSASFAMDSAFLAGGANQISATLDCLIYANILGSNIGTKLTPIGSLATLLWLFMLRKQGIYISLKTFLKCGILITPPVLLSALLAL